MGGNISTNENESLSGSGVITGSTDAVSKESFIDAIHEALRSGRYSDATQRSQEALKFFPEDEEIQKYARILAPPKIISYKLPPDKRVEANRIWMKENAKEYRGKCIALRNGELLGVAENMKDLVAKVGKGDGILITRVV